MSQNSADSASESLFDREVIREAGDPNRLMEGEKPDTRLVEDCDHWISTYTELRDFKDRLLATARMAQESVGAIARRETAMDIRLLSAERDRLLARLEFWQKRKLELT